MLFDIPKEKSSIIKVVGVGGGGGNAVGHMFNQGITGVDFAICNTDNQAMENSPVNVKIQLGPKLTEGRGAGTKPEVGKEACIESIDEVRTFINKQTKMLFITAGMGGGTGTGAAPIIAKAAREEGILTVGVVTLPFKFEGLKRQRQALEGLEQLKSNVDAILVISNDKLREIFGNLSITEAFAEADNILTTAVKGIAEIITIPGYVNVDFEDVNTVMRKSGVAIMGNALAEGEDRARKAISKALNSPLLEDNDIRGAKHILLNITSGTKEVTMDEIGEITDYVQEEAGYGTDLVWGNCSDESLGDKISITLIATGFGEGNKKLKKPVEEKIIVSLDDDEEDIIERTVSVGHSKGEKALMIDFDVDDIHPKKEFYEDSTREKSGLVYNLEGDRSRDLEAEKRAQAKIRESEMDSARRAYLRKQATKPLDNPQIIAEMENTPAYKRRKVILEDSDAGNKDRPTSHKVSVDDDEMPLFYRNNSFLHDNID